MFMDSILSSQLRDCHLIFEDSRASGGVTPFCILMLHENAKVN